MSKRKLVEDNATQSKRVKVRAVSDSQDKMIISAQQLQQTLIFQQDAVPQMRNGLQSFKNFLDSILYASTQDDVSNQHRILRDFLDSQKPQDSANGIAVALPQVMQAWSFASSSNNDGLLSAVIALLALLLKTISSSIVYRQHGLDICKTLLQQTQLQLISKALSAPKNKERVISPCLRLLTEVVSFDGGSMAKQVYAARSCTFDVKSLSRNLHHTHQEHKTSADTTKIARASVRSNAVRYLLATFRFLTGPLKGELLKYGAVLRALFQHIPQDSPEVLDEIFNTLTTNIFLDSTVPRYSKNYTLNEHNLTSIVSMYRTDTVVPVENEALRPGKLAHSFLQFVCKNPAAGLLRHCSGYYPPEAKTEVGTEIKLSSFIDIGLDSIEWFNKYKSNVPVRNATLASFAQSLKPYSNLNESELLLDMFRAAPELVPDYFFKKTGFTFDPKLSATWIGYAAFLFSTVQIPVPKFFGAVDGYGAIPPPTSLVIEHILLQPLTQKTLTRCFNQQHDLITLFVARLMIVAFQKLETCLNYHREASAQCGTLWEEGRKRLLSEFVARCPKIRDVISSFRKTSSSNKIQREALLGLLSLYYEITPQIALEEKFDVSVFLNTALKDFEDAENNLRDKLDILQLKHLLRIARWAPDVRWWHKNDSMEHSTFTTLLKLITTMPQETMPATMSNLLQSIIETNDIVQRSTSIPAFEALLASLEPSEEWSSSLSLFEFLDDLFFRVVQRPIKYQDDLDDLVGVSKVGPVSLIVLTMAEQWPFVETKVGPDNIASWYVRFLSLLRTIGEDETVISTVLDEITTSKNRFSETVVLTLNDVNFNKILTQFSRTHEPTAQLAKLSGPLKTDTDLISIIDPDLFATPSEPSNPANVLHRWSTKPLPEAFALGDISALVLSLSSQYTEVRQQAFQNILQIQRQLSLPLVADTSFPDRLQLHLLIGIVTNTIQTLTSTKPISEVPMPYLFTNYIAQIIPILLNPLHQLYSKANRFHLRGPRFQISRLPSYWTHQILSKPPSEPSVKPSPSDPAPKWQEVPFLITYIYDSLRSEADLEILRQRDVFESILALLNDPFLPGKIRQQIIRLLWRTTCIPGGSDVLIMRTGIFAILGGFITIAPNKSHTIENKRSQQQDALQAEYEDINQDAKHDSLVTRDALAQLVMRLWNTCSQARVRTWGNVGPDGVEKAVKDIVGDSVFEKFKTNGSQDVIMGSDTEKSQASADTESVSSTEDSDDEDEQDSTDSSEDEA